MNAVCYTLTPRCAHAHQAQERVEAGGAALLAAREAPLAAPLPRGWVSLWERCFRYSLQGRGTVGQPRATCNAPTCIHPAARLRSAPVHHAVLVLAAARVDCCGLAPAGLLCIPHNARRVDRQRTRELLAATHLGEQRGSVPLRRSTHTARSRPMRRPALRLCHPPPPSRPNSAHVQ